MTITETTPEQKKITLLLGRLLGLIENQKTNKDGLGLGRSSLALLYCYYGRFFDKESYLERGMTAIEEVFDNVANQRSSIETFDYYRGLVGFVIVITHLKKHEFLDVDLSDFEPFDELIFQWASRETGEGNIDFLAGPTGALHYFIERIGAEQEVSPKTRSTLFGYLEKLLSDIALLFEKRGDDRFFIVNQYYNRVDKRLEREINYSLAHGMSGMLLALLNLREQGLFTAECDNLLLPSIKTILSLQSSKSHPKPFFFANSLDSETGECSYQERIGWCYSDLNLLHVLIRANHVYGSELAPQALLDEAALAITARKSHADTLLSDPFLCHGFAGVSHYYLVLHQLTQNKLFKEAADHWMAQTLAFYDTHEDPWFFTKDFTATGHCLSFLYGNVGVCLCLIAAIHPDASTWSEIILVK